MGVTCITLLAYALPLRHLYVSEDIRSTATALLEQSSEQYGLPLSDFFFTYVGKRDFRLCRRVHQRGNDPISCDWFSVHFLPQ
jgi:hypothetical protein